MRNPLTGRSDRARDRSPARPRRADPSRGGGQARRPTPACDVPTTPAPLKGPLCLAWKLISTRSTGLSKMPVAGATDMKVNHPGLALRTRSLLLKAPAISQASFSLREGRRGCSPDFYRTHEAGCEGPRPSRPRVRHRLARRFPSRQGLSYRPHPDPSRSGTENLAISGYSPQLASGRVIN